MAAMERDEVMKLVRDHLSTELEVVPDRIQPDTRFREDLDADSLDLYELVMELEDRYGIRVSEEEEHTGLDLTQHSETGYSLERA